MARFCLNSDEHLLLRTVGTLQEHLSLRMRIAAKRNDTQDGAFFIRRFALDFPMP